MELEKIKQKVSKISKEKNISIQSAWDILFFDEIIYRLSNSKYKNCLVFKGGFYLQSIIGVETRTTMDIDFKLIGNKLSENELKTMFEEICSGDDEIKFKILSINDIKAETAYGGKTVKIEAKFYNIRKNFGIDIGFGDVVTPYPINYSYNLYYRESSCDVLAYSVETIIAEKFETIISKGIINSRSKDLFDLYLLCKNGYDADVLNAAMVNTFHLRNTIYDKRFIDKTLFEVFNYERIKTLYDNYSRKNSFAKDTTFEMCKTVIYSIFSNLKFEEKINLKDFDIKLHLIRHGEDEQDKVGGWSDNHLTEKGISEVELLSNEIDEAYDLFVSSDLIRAVETSDIINEKLKMEIQYSSLFREVNNGDLKNMSKGNFLENYKELIFANLKMNQKYPGGESPIEFYERIKDAFAELLKNNKGKKILLVTHGGVITVILCLINGIKYSNLLKITPKTGTITKLED